MALFQALAIGLLALIITPGYLFYFDVTPKVVVLLAGAGLALLGCGVGLPRATGRRYRLFSLLLVLDLLSLAISTALSTNPALSAFGTNWRRFGSVIQAAILLFAWLVATHTAGRAERVRTILRGIVLSGGLSAVYGIAQYFGWDPFLPAAGYHIGEGIWSIVRPPGTMGYVSYFATWLLFVAFLSVALAVLEQSVWWRRVAFATAALSTVAMVLTGTRAAILGLVGGVAAAVYLSWRGTSRIPRVSWRIPAAAALVFAACAGFYFSPAGQNLRSRTRWFVEDPWGGARPSLWRDTLRMAAARLPLGYGPEVFTAAFPHFKSKALAEAYPDFLHESPHNIFLDALVSQGIPGLLILCCLCLVGLRSTPDEPRGPAAKNMLSRRTAPAQPGRWIEAALVAGIVSQQFTVFTVPTAFIFYIAIALAVALDSQPAEQPPALRYRLAAAPVTLALLYLSVRFTAADHTLALARHSIESGDLRSATDNYERYSRWNLPGAASDLWYSRALLGLAQATPNFTIRYQAFTQSGTAALRATTSAEDPFNAWYNLATLYATRNDAQRTEQSLRAAIDANPTWFKPHWALAQLLRLEHRLPDAEQEAALAAELDAGKNPEVSKTLSEIRAQIGQAGPPEDSSRPSRTR